MNLVFFLEEPSAREMLKGMNRGDGVSNSS